MRPGAFQATGKGAVLAAPGWAGCNGGVQRGKGMRPGAFQGGRVQRGKGMRPTGQKPVAWANGMFWHAEGRVGAMQAWGGWVK